MNSAALVGAPVASASRKKENRPSSAKRVGESESGVFCYN